MLALDTQMFRRHVTSPELSILRTDIPILLDENFQVEHKLNFSSIGLILNFLQSCFKLEFFKVDFKLNSSWKCFTRNVIELGSINDDFDSTSNVSIIGSDRSDERTNIIIPRTLTRDICLTSGIDKAPSASLRKIGSAG